MRWAAQHSNPVLLLNKKGTPRPLPHPPFSCVLILMPRRQCPWEGGHGKDKALVFAQRDISWILLLMTLSPSEPQILIAKLKIFPPYWVVLSVK